jgi:hypothetical protein
MNYSQLVSEIESFVENKFEVADINTFITQAEQRIYNQIQLPALRKNVTGNTTSGNKYLTCPSDWLATFSLAVIDPVTGEYDYLLNKDVNFIREAFPYPAVEGKPTHYAQFDQDTFILGPTPDDDYDMELHYFYYPASIVDAGTSWLGDNFDTALLYGCLLEAYTFMKGEQDVMAAYQKRYDEAMAMLKMLGDGKNRTDAYRDGQARYPVM